MTPERLPEAAADLPFEAIRVGDRRSFDVEITPEAVATFAGITGDRHPLHADEAFAASTPFGRRIVPGMLVAAQVEALLGMLLPGRRGLHLAQEIRFARPVPVGSALRVEGVVLQKTEATRVLVIDTRVLLPDGKVALDGRATVRVGA